jgi:hypothetical protein
VAERAAVNQTVRSFVAPASTASDITPGVTPPNDGDQTIGNVTLTITKARRVPFRWNGEETRGVNNGGPGTRAIQSMQIQQALRTLTNEMEADLAACISPPRAPTAPPARLRSRPISRIPRRFARSCRTTARR